MLDGKAFGEEMVSIVRGFMAAEVEPLREQNQALVAANEILAKRLTELEARELLLPEKGDPGEVDMEEVRGIVTEVVAAAVEAIPVPQDGKSVDIDEVKQFVADAVAAIPAPKDGADADMDVVKAYIAEEVAIAVCSLPPAKAGDPGKDADMEEVSRLIDDGVKSAVAALPAPKDGDPGKDGLGLADALIDRDGGLVLTMTDGTTKSLGQVVGKDGDPGKDGEVFTLDDFDIIPLDDERSFKFCFTRGDVLHSFEFAFPVVLDRGVWAEGKAYEKGDATTWAGSLWIAQRDAPGKPDTADSGWRLSVKKGRDGKDAAK